MADNEETSSSADDWTAAESDFMFDKGIVNTDPLDKEEPSTPKKVDEERDSTKTTLEDEHKTEPKKEEKKEEKKDDSKDKKEGEEEDDADLARKNEPENQPNNKVIRDQRAIQRELAEDRQATLKEVKEKIFKDVPVKLTDMEGDPIETVEDVMGLVNPITKQPFTEEEAAAWLLAATQALNKTINEKEQLAEKIADLSLSLKDQADEALEKYGELFKQVPGLQKRAWETFYKTLKVDPETDLIIDAPLSIEEVYDMLLSPYIENAKLAEESDKDSAEEAKAKDAQRKQEQEKKVAEEKKRNRQDRSDIYNGSKVDLEDDEEKSWGKAYKEYYG